MQAKRIIYPLPKNDNNYRKFDMMIKCKRGETANLLTQE